MGALRARGAKVHVDSLLILRHPEPLSEPARETILDGLARVVGRTARAAE